MNLAVEPCLLFGWGSGSVPESGARGRRGRSHRATEPGRREGHCELVTRLIGPAQLNPLRVPEPGSRTVESDKARAPTQSLLDADLKFQTVWPVAWGPETSRTFGRWSRIAHGEIRQVRLQLQSSTHGTKATNKLHWPRWNLVPLCRHTCSLKCLVPRLWYPIGTRLRCRSPVPWLQPLTGRTLQNGALLQEPGEVHVETAAVSMCRKWRRHCQIYVYYYAVPTSQRSIGMQCNNSRRVLRTDVSEHNATTTSCSASQSLGLATSSFTMAGNCHSSTGSSRTRRRH